MIFNIHHHEAPWIPRSSDTEVSDVEAMASASSSDSESAAVTLVGSEPVQLRGHGG